MKLLIAYDGSSSADRAIDDLQRAGLPEKDVDVNVVSVAEVWMPPPPNGHGFSKEDYPVFINKISEKRLKVAKSAINEAETLCRHARERILSRFPKWNVKAESTNGSPGWEILNRANKTESDLIMVGSQGRNAVGRILMGSISQKLLTEANCSVRVVHGKVRDLSLPIRIMIAFDGSIGSKNAVKAVAERDWGEGAEVCLVTAVHSLFPETIGRFVPPVKEWLKEDFKSEKQWIEKLTQGSSHLLENAGLKVHVDIQEGSPKEVIVEQARKWQADSIFVGAHSYSSSLEKHLIGSTSAAIATRAACSVEAVRPKPEF
jgi:nucleotide-binding universal stress UspA family protein